MKAAVFHGIGIVHVEERSTRSPGPGEVRVRVMACGVCGTDLHIFAGAEGAAPCTPPTVLGHEFAGIVESVGPEVATVRPGDRVCVDPNDACGACDFCLAGQAHFCERMVGIGTTTDGGFAEFCTVRAKQVHPIGEALSFEEGAMAEPVACCLHGIDLTGIRPGATVLLLGGGTIGQIMLQLVRLSGAARVALVEPVAEKRRMAERFGADLTVDPFAERVEEALVRHGFGNIDAAIECVGLKSTMEDAIRLVGRGGTAMLFGLSDPALRIPLAPFDVFRKEIAIRASFINPYTQARAVALLRERRVDVKSLITDILPLDRIGEVFRDESYRRRGKVVIQP